MPLRTSAAATRHCTIPAEDSVGDNAATGTSAQGTPIPPCTVACRSPDEPPFSRCEPAAGWAVAESIAWLAERAEAVGDQPLQCRELLHCLGSPLLRQAAHTLDQISDLPEYQRHRGDYEELCDVLQEAEAVLLRVPEPHPHMHAHQDDSQRQPGPERREHSQGLTGPSRRQRLDSSNPRDLCKALQPFCKLERYAQLQGTLHSMRPPDVTGTCDTGATTLQLQSDQKEPPASIQRCHVPSPPQHLFKQRDKLVPHIDDLLKTARNVGLVGKGGIGKTTIARAVFERARLRFDAAVWLTVRYGAADVLPLLEAAFAELFPGCVLPFDTADEVFRHISERLKAENRSVLLVLDDVWTSIQPAVVTALNFATCPGERSERSRMIVTAQCKTSLAYQRERRTGGAASGRGWWSEARRVKLMHELEAVVLEPFDSTPSQQLLYHHAFRAASTAQAPPRFVPAGTCSQLIRTCGGNPLALQVLGGVLRQRTSAEHWQRQLAAVQVRLVHGEDPATAVCGAAVDALPPSLKTCFLEFAAFPEGALISEADLLHLFATHAPLLSPSSLEAAASKLDELVCRGLVSKEVSPSGKTVLQVHDILWGFALHHVQQDADPSPALARQLSDPCSGVPSGVAAAAHSHYSKRGDPKGLRACIVHMRAGGLVPRGTTGASTGRLRHFQPVLRTSARTLRYLWLQGSATRLSSILTVSVAVGDSESQVAHWPLLHFLKLECQSPPRVKQPSCATATSRALSMSGTDVGDEVAVDAARCTRTDCSMPSMPSSRSDSIVWELPCWQSPLLMHLDLSDCTHLSRIPDTLGSCSQLTSIDLSRCGALLQLPDAIGACSRLARLDLSHCASLTHLPDTVGGCSELSYLSLRACRALQALPEMLGSCSRLATLDGSFCESLTQLPERLGRCHELTELRLAGCRSLPNLPIGIGGCSQLLHLNLNQCCSIWQLPRGIQRCSRLASINLEEGSRIVQVPDCIAACSYLTSLNLACCKSLVQLPSSIGCCRQLAHLNLRGCMSLTRLPESVGECGRLTHLDLSECIALAQLPLSIAGCAALVVLNLRGCAQLTRLPDSVGGLPRLETLNLCRCVGLLRLPEGVGGCCRLREVWLVGCSALARLPESLRRCGGLRRVCVRGCQAGLHIPTLATGAVVDWASMHVPGQSPHYHSRSSTDAASPGSVDA